MAIVYANSFFLFRQRTLLIVSLLTTWLLGFLLGYYFCEPSFFSMMRSVVFEPVSIVGLFTCLFLPLLFSFFSVITNHPVIILIVCFLKAVSFGFSCAILSGLFTSAAWMIRFLLLFSDSCFCVVLLVLWICRFRSWKTHSFCDFFTCSFIGIGIAAADIFVISPYLQGLL